MKRELVRRMCGAAMMLVLSAWGAPGLVRSGELVPYKGTIEGRVVISTASATEGELLAQSAQVISSHLGKGTQRYDDLRITSFGAHGLQAVGLCTTIAASGDQLRIQFSMGGPFIGPGTIAYIGEYRIIPGGTGRFACDDLSADLGQGALAGQAEIELDPVQETTTITFRHDFTGTIRLHDARPRKQR